MLILSPNPNLIFSSYGFEKTVNPINLSVFRLKSRAVVGFRIDTCSLCVSTDFQFTRSKMPSSLTATGFLTVNFTRGNPRHKKHTPFGNAPWFHW